MISPLTMKISGESREYAAWATIRVVRIGRRQQLGKQRLDLLLERPGFR
jgi:hypothetical protein